MGLFSALKRWMLLRDPDLRYIVRVGVDSIPEVREPEPPSIARLGVAAESIEEGSRFMDSEEAVLAIAASGESRASFEAFLPGVRGQLSGLLVEEPRILRGAWYLVVVSDEWMARLLTYYGVVTGAQLHMKTETLYGLRALEAIDEYRGNVSVKAVRLRDRIAEWDPSKLSVFVRGIDRQHQFLIANLNLLYLGLIAGEASRALEEVLSNLVEYTKFHFRSEERLFDKLGYPEDEAERHRREHASFTRRVVEFHEAYRAGEAALTFDVLRFLASWLRGHIAGSDRRFGVWLKYEARSPLAE